MKPARILQALKISSLPKPTVNPVLCFRQGKSECFISAQESFMQVSQYLTWRCASCGPLQLTEAIGRHSPAESMTAMR